jgi:hypothetical protein
MNTVDLLVDAVIVPEAVRLAEEFVGSYGELGYGRESDWPVSRAQLKGLLQIASNEPEQLVNFADHQAEKARRGEQSGGRSRRIQPENPKEAFWKLIKEIVQGDPQRKRWSLEKLRRECVPPEFQPASGETSQAKKEREAKLREWERQWNREVFPVFFRTFVNHFLYLMEVRRPREKSSSKGR